jgi:hypothetical protein
VVSASDAQPRWGLRSSRQPWLDRLATRIESRSKLPEWLCDEWPKLVSRITAGARAGADWAYHPSLDLLARTEMATDSRDLQAILYVLAAQPDLKIATSFPERCSVWFHGTVVDFSPGYLVPPEQDLTSLPDPELDFFGYCVGRQFPDVAASADHIRAPEAARWVHAGARYSAALGLLREIAPGALEWIRAATRLIVPMRSRTDGRVRSTSHPRHVGAVFMNLPDVVPLLEALIHESAHQHYFLADMATPLVADTALRLYSPLRRELRPLRGVFLAFHALAFIEQLYRCIHEAVPGLYRHYRRVHEDVRNSLLTACGSMLEGRDGLTSDGDALFRSTLELVSP